MKTTLGATVMACIRIIESDDDLDQPNEDEIQYQIGEIHKAAEKEHIFPVLAALLLLGDLGKTLAEKIGVVVNVTEGEEDEEDREETETDSQSDPHFA